MRTLSAIALLTSSAGFGQPAAAPQSFEVASVKVSQIGRAGGEGSRRERVDHTPGSLTMRNVSLKSAIQYAFNVKQYQVTGPGWIETEPYEINGRAGAAG